MRIVTDWFIFKPFVTMDKVGIVPHPMHDDEVICEIIYANMSERTYRLLRRLITLLADCDAMTNEEYLVSHGMISRY